MGGRASRVKGFAFEREVVKAFQASGLPARRFWGSDGRSAGLPEKADVEAAGRLYQCKRLKKLPELLTIPEGVGGMICRQDGKETVAVVPLAYLIEVLEQLRNCRT